MQSKSISYEKIRLSFFYLYKTVSHQKNMSFNLYQKVLYDYYFSQTNKW